LSIRELALYVIKTYKTIYGLDKHQSILNLAGSDPILNKEKAFWELLKEEK